MKNNLIIALNILQIKEKEMCPVYISKNNSNCQKQTILLMIPSEEKEGWHFLMLKKLSTSSRGSKHQNIMVIFIVENVFILLEQKLKLNLMKKYVKIKISVEF